LNAVLDRLERPDEPATERQVALLEGFGVKVPPGLTKRTASFAIGAIFDYRARFGPAPSVATQGGQPESETAGR
jgi:hypothetical protein